MRFQFRTLIFLTALLVGFASSATPSAAAGLEAGHPWFSNQAQETVIVANAMDARFARDYSTLLKHLRLEWLTLDKAEIPEWARGMNLVLIGHPDAPYTGEVIRTLLAPEELDELLAAQDHTIKLTKDNPWAQERRITICSGSDFILRRDAAEQALRAMIAEAPPASEWIQSVYNAPIDDNLRRAVDELRYTWENDELPLEDLIMDVESAPPRRITVEQAVEDVERIFYLFSHGYSGYAFFDARAFEEAQARILQALLSRSSWSSDALSDLLSENLGFIEDCHTRIGEHRFSSHRDFWYDTQLSILLRYEGYQFESGGQHYTIHSINGADPAPYLLPSLNREGEPIYRLGLLSQEQPAPLTISTDGDEGERSFRVKLRRSDLRDTSGDVFREYVLGGIPVLRVRGFADSDAESLREFAMTGAEYRDQSVVVLDVRGNGGGNEHWPISWIQSLTGRRAESIFVSSELESKTSLAGRLNAFSYWIHEYDMELYRDDLEQHLRLAESIEDGVRLPGWSGTRYPTLPLIPNDTTVILVADGRVASAGEGLIMRISQVENVTVVGENSMGCLTFGNISTHKLPNSGLMVWLPINFGLFPDQEVRESVGLAPDLWVPADDALNYTVAALRRGTINTARPLPFSAIEQPFTPETRWSRLLEQGPAAWLLIAGFIIAGAVFAYVNRAKVWLLLVSGVVWIGIGSYLIGAKDQPALGVGFFLMGLIYLAAGSFKFITMARQRLKP
jgi:hypothetical protein